MSAQPSLLTIRVIGDAILRRRAEEVRDIDDELKCFAVDFTHTMYQKDGVGLAAPQVGVSRRLIVVDPHWAREGKARQPLLMINPVIESVSGVTETEEGCLSLPGIYAHVERPANITVSYTDLEGQRLAQSLSGYPAVVIQHEIDHLDGVLFVDHLGTLARLKLKRRIKELESRTVNGVNLLAEE
ncbi:MAG TPA: peptide deformylase [Candidatus Syntrophosphaera sp.]|nr:peptide deformylase [Candidatus Syntrophosphaera sp.]